MKKKVIDHNEKEIIEIITENLKVLDLVDNFA